MTFVPNVPATNRNLPVGDAGGQYAGDEDAVRLHLVQLVAAVVDVVQVDRAGVVAQYQAELLVHRPLDLEQQRAHAQLDRLHHRDVVLDHQVRVAGRVHILQNVLCLREALVKK